MLDTGSMPISGYNVESDAVLNFQELIMHSNIQITVRMIETNSTIDYQRVL